LKETGAMNVTTSLLIERLQLHAQKMPDRLAYTFLRDDGKIDEITYAELDARARVLAAKLLEQARQGDRALLLYPAGLDFVIAFLACLAAGIIAVPATIPHKGRASRRLAALLQDADPGLILTISDCETAVKASLSLVEAHNRVCLSTDVARSAPSNMALPQPDPGDIAFLQYTSGSTSAPKGVQISHGNIASNVEAIRKAYGFNADSVMVSWLPLFHDMGLIGSVVSPLFVGFRSVLMAPVTFLKNPLLWLQAISQYRGTCAGAPNFGWDYCVRKIREDQKAQLDLASLRVAYNGSEPVRAETLRRFSGAFEQCGMRMSALFPCYGMAEATLFIAGGPRSEPPKIRTVSKALLEGNQVREAAPGSSDAREIVSSGRIAENTDVKIVDPETCLPCSPHRVGEVWVQGPSVAQGYWNNAEQTAAAFSARLASDGSGPYLRTGDLAFVHEGELFITGRLKDMVIINGRNVYPQDIEEVIEQSISFIEPNMCAAFSVEINGQEQLAIVAEANRSMVRAAQLRMKECAAGSGQGQADDDYLSKIEAMAANICTVITQQFDVTVSSIVFVKPGTFPRTTSGKVQRSRCRAMALEGQLDVTYVMPGSIFDRRIAREPVPSRPMSAPTVTTTARAQQDDLDLLILPAADSRRIADEMIAWLRQYAPRRINSRLIDERRTVPPHIVLDLGNQGFFGLQVPRSFGGRGLAVVDLLRVLEQLAAVDLTVATLVGVHNGLGVRPILRYGDRIQKDDLLPLLAGGRQLASFALTEPGAGSNPLAMQANAVRHGGGWRVTAEKQWIGLASWAGVLTLFAKAYDSDGKALGTIAFALREDTPGMVQGPEALTMGMRGIVQNTVYLRDAWVPDSAVLLRAGEGMTVARDAMTFSRLGIVAMCLGAMKRCFQLMVRYGKNRQIATGRLLDNPVTQLRLSELSGIIHTLQSLMLRIADMLDAGEGVPAEAYLAAKVSATELLGDAADKLMQLLGGRGYIESNIAPQLLRDARVLRILEGPSETLYTHLGASVRDQPQPLANFVGQTMGSPQVAARLANDVARCESTMGAGKQWALPAAGVQWLDYCIGELSAKAVLLAAAGDDNPARAWAEREYERLLAAILEKLDAPQSLDDDRLRAAMEMYEAAIGDVSQGMAGASEELDPLLRKVPAPAIVAEAATAIASLNPAPRSKKDPKANTSHSAVQTAVREWLRRELRREVHAVDGDAPFGALGIDSLGVVSVALALERRFEVDIPPELLYDYNTINSLATHIDALLSRKESTLKVSA
jgi:acyl-CoA synthetase (AMP-forming)/AMP-acid ligase II/alkylation response protein AidB-like acyl-CoA dehydrogenase/acyl carrier protein